MEMGFSMIKARIAEDQSDRRRFSRLPVELEAKMRELGASGVEARVLNISESGFMAISDARVEVGSRMPWSSGSPATRSAPSSPSRSRSRACAPDPARLAERLPHFITPDCPIA